MLIEKKRHQKIKILCKLRNFEELIFLSTKWEVQVINFYSRSCLLKSSENLLKYLTLVLSRFMLRQKCFFFHKKNDFFESQPNYLHILKQCNKTFQMSYQEPLYVLFYPGLILILLIPLILMIRLQSPTTYVLFESH